MLTVGAFAAVAGVSARMLRAYDELRLFRPAWVDRESGYRYYSPAQLPELRRILALRELGVSLAEIDRLGREGADLRAVLERRRRELEEERRAIERRLAALEIEMGASHEHEDRLDVVVRPVPVMNVAALPLALAGGRPDAAFYELEAYVRDRRRRANGPPGTIAGPEAAVFVPLTGSIDANDRIHMRRLPATRVATMLHRGSYAGLRIARSALDAWVARAGFTDVGPLRVLYLQFGAEPELRVPRAYVVDDATRFVTELQLPVAEG